MDIFSMPTDHPYWTLNEINRENKEVECQYCEKPVRFVAVDITTDPFDAQKEKIKWECRGLGGSDHTSVCLGSPDYKPKFTKGDVILSQWKAHSTMYIVGEVCAEQGVYELIYQKKKHNRTTIPIKTIDKKSSKCNEEMVEAIFGS